MVTTELDESGRVAEQFEDVRVALEALRATDKGLGILAVAVRGDAIYVDSARGGPHVDLGILMHALELCMANLGAGVSMLPISPELVRAAKAAKERAGARSEVNVQGIGKATLLAP